MTPGRRTKLEMEAIYADVEEHMIRLRHEGRVVAQLAAKYNVTRHTVGRWVKEVFARLRAKEAPDDREDRRNMMRGTLDTIASMALNKTTVLRDASGSPMLDGSNKPIRVPAPDLKNALDACKQLRDLDGLDAPIKISKTVEGTTTTTVVLGDEDRAALEAALRGGS